MAPQFVGLETRPGILGALTMFGAGAGEISAALSLPAPAHRTAQARATPQQAEGSLALESFGGAWSDALTRMGAPPGRATPTRITWTGFAFLSPVFAASAWCSRQACANAIERQLANARHREIGIRSPSAPAEAGSSGSSSPRGCSSPCWPGSRAGLAGGLFAWAYCRDVPADLVAARVRLFRRLRLSRVPLLRRRGRGDGPLALLPPCRPRGSR
jgi:hypothetical protein